MDDGSLTFPDFGGGQENDLSWADEFLDGIQCEDQNALELLASEIELPGEALPPIGGSQGIMGGQVQVQIPTHLQASLPHNSLQQASSNISGTVAYLTPSATTNNSTQGASTPVTNFSQPQAALQSLTQQQTNPQLVQLTQNFPVASVQQINSSVPLQTFLSSSQTIAGQTIYRGQGGGLFPAQGSVHIENPKVVNVNFGPSVIGSDGGSQQGSFIQTAEGKQVFITNSQLQQMSQSLNLSQPLVAAAGTQLLNQGAGGTVLRTSLPQQQQATRQIVLPTGQTVVQRQADTVAGKNMVLRQINPSSVIYPTGQAGQLQLQSQPTALIATSGGQGLQVVNASAGQGNQVQLITQGQQQLNQNTIMNLINNQGVINNGLVSTNQNILVNGQVVNLSQLGGLAMQQLQLQQPGGVSVQQGGVNVQGGVSVQQIQQQSSTNQQQLFLQQNAATGLVGSNSPMSTQQLQAQLLLQQQQQRKVAVGIAHQQLGRTPTPNNMIGSNSSTPAPTPTPSTPTPTPTPDPTFGKEGQGGINILEQALSMSKIDLQSFEDDFNMFGTPDECLATVTTPPPAPPVNPTPPPPKPKPKPKKQTKKAKAAAAAAQAQAVTQITQVSNQQQTTATTTVQINNTQLSNTQQPQKMVTMNGQVYVLSANGQQLILQQQPAANTAAAVVTTVTNIAPQLKPIPSLPAPTVNNSPSSRLNGSLPSSSVVGVPQQTAQLNMLNNIVSLSPSASPGVQQTKTATIKTQRQTDNKLFTKLSVEPAAASTTKVQSGSPQQTFRGPISFMQTLANSKSSTAHKAASPIFTAQTNQFPVIQVKPPNKVSTLGGVAVVKQEPVVVKDEPIVVSDMQTSNTVTNMITTPVAAPLPQVVSQSTAPPQPLRFLDTVRSCSGPVTVVSAPVVTVATTSVISTTQFHQSTIMTSTPSSVVGSTTPVSVTTTTTATSTPASSAKSNVKEKDPMTIKTMTPITIGNSTLMLSLTPAQKERLEKHLSKMSMKEQTDFVEHQQNLNKHIQLVKQKNLQEQQKKNLQVQQQQQQQQKSLQQQKTLQQQHKTMMQQQKHLQKMQQAQTTKKKSKKEQQAASSHQQKKGGSQAAHAKPNQAAHVSVISTYPSTSVETSSVGQAGATAVVPSGGGLGSTATVPTTVEELDVERVDEKTSVAVTVGSLSGGVQHQQPEKVSQQPGQTAQPEVQTQPQTRPTRSPYIPAGSIVHTSHGIIQLGKCHAELQLTKDRQLALSPDVKTQFKNCSDAMRRLVRYHTLQDHKPSEDSKAMKTWDTKYSKLCDYLMKKKRYYMRRYNKMRLYNDMCGDRRPESLQNLLCFNEQLKETFEAEKERARTHPELFEPMLPVKRETSPAESSQVDRSRESSPAYDEDDMPSSSGVGRSPYKQSSSQGTAGWLQSREQPAASYDDDRPSSSNSSRRSSYKQSSSQSTSGWLQFKDQPAPLKEEVMESRTKHSMWEPREPPKPSPPSLKRKACHESASSGTLKLVFKRRTTDDFSVKNSSEVFKVEDKSSDSEGEFEESHRTPPSRQSSYDDGASDRSEDGHNQSSGEEEEEEESMEEGESQSSEGEEEGEEENGNVDFVGDSGDGADVIDRHVQKSGHHVSFQDSVRTKSEVALLSGKVSDPESDAFMDSENVGSKTSASSASQSSGRNLFSSVFKFSDISSADTGSFSSGKKSSRVLSHTASITSVTSDDVFTSGGMSDSCGGRLSSPATTATTGASPELHASIPSHPLPPAHQSPPSSAHKLLPSPPNRAHTFPSTLHKSPPQPAAARFTTAISASNCVSPIEREAARKGLPTTSIFTTPSKSLLQTDAMFNSSSDEEDSESLDRNGLVGRFRIDNKDPQSSMINASVRSAINSVLNSDDD